MAPALIEVASAAGTGATPLSTPPGPAPQASLIDRLLAEQRELTAVEKFAHEHDLLDERGASGLPAQARYYRDLIPLSSPGPGEQYAFEVDLDACSGCKACVAACHNLNGLDELETWRDVGLLVGAPSGPAAAGEGAREKGGLELPILQHVTMACHHCLEPACLSGCPVKAYEKDPVTGIVRHLDDQCIGCQYCILKCPYDAPKYHVKKGIVRKCDMCSDRLAVGEAPACVQSCPNGAIRIRLVDRARVALDSREGTLVPGAARPDYTQPTTRYKTRRPQVSRARPADYYQVEPEHAHLALVVMLVLTQLSAGAFVVGQVLERLADAGATAALRPVQAVVALAIGLLALGASTLHLGRPLYAFRAVLGLRTSWLSREIVAFGLFAGMASAYAGAVWGGALPAAVRGMLGAGVAVAGALGVFCSVMIYHDTRRAFWQFRHTAPKFFMSTLLLGLGTALTTAVAGALGSGRLTVQQALHGWGGPACLLLAGLTLAKLGYGALVFRHLGRAQYTPLNRTARLLAGPLLNAVLARYALGLAGGVLLPVLAAGMLGRPAGGEGSADLAVVLVAALPLTVGGELLERYLFFTAVVPPKMPGGI